MTETYNSLLVSITDAWMKHLGYTKKEISEFDVGNHVELCEFDGQDYRCNDENEISHHPGIDDLANTSEMVAFVLDILFTDEEKDD